MGAVIKSEDGVWVFLANGQPIDAEPPPPSNVKFLDLPGTAGAVARVTAGPNLNVAGSHKIYALVRMADFSPGALRLLATKWADANNQRSFTWGIAATGAAYHQHTSGGLWPSGGVERPTGVPGPEPEPNEWTWIELGLNAPNGVVSYREAPAPAVITSNPAVPTTGWVTLAATSPTTAAAPIYSSSARFTIGSIDEGDYQNFIGDIAQLALADAAGTILFRLDPGNWVSGPTWSTSTGHTVTLAGAATVATLS